MKKFKVSDLKPGMMFDQPVYIDPSNVLVQAKQEILERDIERLKKWGILEVETNGRAIEPAARGASGSSAPASGASAPASGEAPSSSGTQKPPVGGAAPSAGAASGTPAPAAPRISPKDDPELQRAAHAYDAFRKNKRNFRGVLYESGETLQQNVQALLDGKPFENQTVLRTAARLADEIAGQNLMLLGFYSIRYTGSWQILHAMHAAAYGVILGQAFNYSRPRLHELAFGMLLMDTGMFRIPVHVREKTSELSDAERQTVKTHPLLGYQLLIKNGKVKASLATVALQHHEAFDGSGYPQALKSGQIEETSRIAAIADSYTAMIEKRPHRKPILPYDAMKTLLSVQMNRYDPRMLRTFLGRISIYPIGSLVQLSSQQIGMVISCRPDKPLRPILRLLRDEQGLPYSRFEFLDLIKETDLYIVRALDAVQAGVDLESET